MCATCKSPWWVPCVIGRSWRLPLSEGWSRVSQCWQSLVRLYGNRLWLWKKYADILFFPFVGYKRKAFMHVFEMIVNIEMVSASIKELKFQNPKEWYKLMTHYWYFSYFVKAYLLWDFSSSFNNWTSHLTASDNLPPDCKICIFGKNVKPKPFSGTEALVNHSFQSFFYRIVDFLIYYYLK